MSSGSSAPSSTRNRRSAVCKSAPWPPALIATSQSATSVLPQHWSRPHEAGHSQNFRVCVWCASTLFAPKAKDSVQLPKLQHLHWMQWTCSAELCRAEGMPCQGHPSTLTPSLGRNAAQAAALAQTFWGGVRGVSSVYRRCLLILLHL